MLDAQGRYVPTPLAQGPQQGMAPSAPAQASAMRGQGIAPAGPSMAAPGQPPAFGGPAQGSFGAAGARPAGGLAATGQQMAFRPQGLAGLRGQMGGMQPMSPQGPQYGQAPGSGSLAPQGPQPGTSWGGAPQGGWSGPMYQQAPQGPPPVGQSVEQSVQTGSPQSVQNFLQALHQAGAGSNNTFQNGAGQGGQGPQAGFTGFGQNGQQGGPGGGFVAYGGPMQSSLSFANNYAGQGQYGQGAAPGASGGGVALGAGFGQGGQGLGGAPAGGPGYVDPTTSDAAAQKRFNMIQDQINSQHAQAQSNADKQFNDYNKARIAEYGNYSDSQSLSDVRSKTDIAPGAGELDDFLKSLGAYTYAYKDPAHGEGRRTSPMAQEIESTPLGRAAVSVDPGTGYKKVDYGKLGGTMLAAQAHLNRKIDKLAGELQAAVLGKFAKKGGA